MKAHLRVDSWTKLIDSAMATSTNVADSRVLPALLPNEGTRGHGDHAYRGRSTVLRRHDARARDFTNRRSRSGGRVDKVERERNRTKANVRARAEHAIGIIKRVFGFA